MLSDAFTPEVFLPGSLQYTVQNYENFFSDFGIIFLYILVFVPSPHSNAEHIQEWMFRCLRRGVVHPVILSCNLLHKLKSYKNKWNTFFRQQMAILFQSTALMLRNRNFFQISQWQHFLPWGHEISIMFLNFYANYFAYFFNTKVKSVNFLSYKLKIFEHLALCICP